MPNIKRYYILTMQDLDDDTDEPISAPTVLAATTEQKLAENVLALFVKNGDNKKTLVRSTVDAISEPVKEVLNETEDVGRIFDMVDSKQDD